VGRLSEDFTAFKDVGGFREYLFRRYQKCQKEKEDTILVVVGGERKGKTTLGLRIKYDLEPDKCYVDKKPDTKDICMSGDQYLRWMALNEKTVGQFDEAGTALFSRDAMSPVLKRIYKKLLVCGYKYLFHIICIQDFFDLDKKIRMRRLSALIRITDKGKFLAYNRDNAIKIGRACSWNAGRPTSKGWWPGNEKNKQYRVFDNAYRKVEKSYKDKYMKDDIDLEEEKDEYLTLPQAAKLLGVARVTVHAWISKGKLKAYHVNNIKRVLKKDIQKLTDIAI